MTNAVRLSGLRVAEGEIDRETAIWVRAAERNCGKRDVGNLEFVARQ
jgi:hypothetical protein